jgi:hypothetical protein
MGCGCKCVRGYVGGCGSVSVGAGMCLCGCACVSELAMRRGVLSHREPCSSLWALAK